ncbi:MAG: aminotransferase class V-fold PLP-dependent enzyme [Saprospiraceae bacterium]|nr:aminotransferase class V-fold PLP-dependent enzyme [Saprospiraceae bacterium]
MMHDISTLRNDTPGCSHVNHLNNAGASLQPRPVLQAVQDHLLLESTTGGYEAADQRADEINGFYGTVARMLNAQARNIAFASSATDAYARALSALNWQPGDVILTTENDYVSNQIAFLALQKRFGVVLLRARDTASGGVDVDHFESLLIQHRPRLAAVTHIPTSSGLIQPVEAIGRICRAHETLYLVDACQSAGQRRLDVQAIGCDFLTATMRKFMRGPRGSGFLYVSDRVLDGGYELLLPDMSGGNWVSPDQYEMAASARRFEYWELPPALILGGKAAVEYAENLGFEWIENQVMQIARFTRETLAQLPGVRVLDQGEQLGGIVTAHASHWNQAEILSKLVKHGINCRISTKQVAQIDFGHKGVEWALRVSPHYYNTEDEIRQLAEVLKQEFPV